MVTEWMGRCHGSVGRIPGLRMFGRDAALGSASADARRHAREACRIGRRRNSAGHTDGLHNRQLLLSRCTGWFDLRPARYENLAVPVP